MPVGGFQWGDKPFLLEICVLGYKAAAKTPGPERTGLLGEGGMEGRREGGPGQGRAGPEQWPQRHFPAGRLVNV